MKLLCKLGLHPWEVVEDTGKTVYEECARCGKRKVWQRHEGGHQLMDKDWVFEERGTES